MPTKTNTTYNTLCMCKYFNTAYVYYPRPTHTRTYTQTLKHSNTQTNTNIHMANTKTNVLIFVSVSGVKWLDVWTITLLGRARTCCFRYMFMCARVSHLRVCKIALCANVCVLMCPWKHVKVRECDLLIGTWTFIYIINFGIFLSLTLLCRLAVMGYRRDSLSQIVNHQMFCSQVSVTNTFDGVHVFNEE